MVLAFRIAVFISILILWPSCLQAGPGSDSPPGTLSLSTEPRSARVYVNGRFYGITPLEIEMEPGRHSVRILRDGYMIEQRSVILKAGARIELPVTLTPAAILEVRSIPGGADLLVDGQIVALTPTEVPVLPGLRRIEVTKQGHEPWIREIRLKAGEKRRFQPELDYIYGRLEIVSTPRGASVYLNNEFRGEASPLVLEDVPPGLYRFRLSLPTYEDNLGEVLVEKGETVSVVERMKHTLTYLERGKKEREARDRVIRRSVRITSFAVGVVSAVYAGALNRRVKDREDLYNRTAYAEQALRYREEVRDWETKRNLWSGVATLSLSVGLLTFVF
ncbi:MAG: PEGA domain-containing protein [Candidatus Eisenbacteria sp.]|nr:PEGA domain-containing protein [Candidatus Eisenbacteria bacterium]